MDEIKTINAHNNDLYSIVFSPAGTTFWSSAMDRTVKEWALESGEEISSTDFPTSVNSLSMAYDGRKIAFGRFGSQEEDNRVGIFDVIEHSVIWDVQASPWWVYCVDFNPVGKKLISSDKYGYLRIWDSETGEKLTEWKAPGGTSRVRYSPSGKMIVSCGDEKLAEVWDSVTYEKLLDLSGHEKWVMQAIFTPDEQRIITCSRDFTVKVWNLQGVCVQTLTASNENARSLALSPNGLILASGWDDGYIRIALLEDGKWQRKIQARYHSKPVSVLCFSPDGKTLVSGGWDNNIITWDMSEYS